MSIVKQLSAACVAATAMTASAEASAHYYAYDYSLIITGAGDHGAAAILRADILHQTCNTFSEGNFVTHEMWYMTDSSNAYWIEVGVYDGEGTQSVFNPCETQTIFWADSRPGGGLAVHFVNNVTWGLGNYYQAEVTSVGSCSWNVYFGNVLLGTSNNNCPGSGRQIRTGIETTTQSSGNVKGFSTGFQAQDGSGNWSSSGWGTMWGGYDAPPNIEWIGNSPWGSQSEETLNESF